jgi:nucleotide-binding universal stress UspA family protein
MPKPINDRTESRPLKLLVYTDGSAVSAKALHFAAQLTQRLAAELTVITTRAGTHAIEPLPPLGRNIDLSDRKSLPSGLQVLTAALDVLSVEGLLERQLSLQVREIPNGHIFVCNTPSGQRIPFYVCFGHLIEILNHEIEKHHYDLLIIAPPQRGRLPKMMLGDISRKLVLDLHTSVLIVRGGRPNSRFLVCADGSAAAKRQFPLLEQFLPVIEPPLELICVLNPDFHETAVQEADNCIQQVTRWLTAYGKQYTVHRLTGDRPAEVIASTAGDGAVIFLGASLRHDAYRRLLGSLPMQILARTKSSVLVVKALPEGDRDYFADPDSSPFSVTAVPD